MFFSRREKFVPEKMLQVDSMDDALRNRLINYLETVTTRQQQIHYISDFNWSNAFLSLMGHRVKVGYVYDVMKLLEESDWNHIFDCIEFILKCSMYLRLDPADFIRNINYILADEMSGYRLHPEGMVKITNENELNEITEAQKSPYKSVSVHLKKAFSLYSDRKKPDYANSIKESISTVESMCCTIIGEKATLGQTLKKLEENGVHIHEAQKKAFTALYGYTSDEAGIRHGSINSANVSAEDAKFMLVTCSAFVNYLKEKCAKI